MRSLLTLFGLAWSIAIAGWAASAQAFDYTLETAQTQIPLAPGGQAEVALTFGNPTAMDSPPLLLLIGSWQDYTLDLTPSASCGELQVSTSAGGLQQARVSIPSIPAASQRQCTLRATRNADTRENLSILLGFMNVPPSEDTWVARRLEFGMFAEVALVANVESREVDSEGIAHTVYRIGAENRSALDLDPVEVNLGNVCVPEPVQIDADLAGGCVLEESPCWFTGGPGKATHLPAVAAGQTTSCLVRFSDSASSSATVWTSINPYFHESSTGNEVYDTGPPNNSLDLEVNVGNGNGNGDAPAQLPANSPWSLAVLLAALAGLGIATRRRLAARSA